MDDKYKELSENLYIIISLIKEFDLSKNDYKKPDIRAYQIKISSLAKIIDDKVLSDFIKLNEFIDDYLSCCNNDNYLKVINSAIKLQNDLWEL